MIFQDNGDVCSLLLVPKTSCVDLIHYFSSPVRDFCLEYIIRAIQRVVVIEKRNQSPPSPKIYDCVCYYKTFMDTRNSSIRILKEARLCIAVMYLVIWLRNFDSECYVQ